MTAPVASFTRVFAAAHRVWNDDSKCRNIHGHNYHVEIKVKGEKPTKQNFIVPFDLIKDVVDSFDHTLIVDHEDPLLSLLEQLGVKLSVVQGVPSTEFMAALIAEDIRALAEVRGLNLSVTVALRETDGIMATAHALMKEPF